MARSYSSEEIMAMQRDAIRRVNEMRRISEEKLRQSAPTPPPQSPSVKPPPVESRPKPTPPNSKPQPVPPVSTGGITAFLQQFGSDHEMLLLLGVLFLLIREGADPALILALVYILL